MNRDVFCFSNLGWGRKIYLVLLWLGTLVFVAFGFNEFLNDSDPDVSTAGYVAIFLILLGVLAWKHFAVVKRRYIQLVIIGIIDLAMFNILSAIVLFIIAHVSKEERAVHPPSRLKFAAR